MEIKKVWHATLFYSYSSSSEPAIPDITLDTADTTTATMITSITIPANMMIPESIRNTPFQSEIILLTGSTDPIYDTTKNLKFCQKYVIITYERG